MEGMSYIVRHYLRQMRLKLMKAMKFGNHYVVLQVIYKYRLLLHTCTREHHTLLHRNPSMQINKFNMDPKIARIAKKQQKKKLNYRTQELCDYHSTNTRHNGFFLFSFQAS